MKVALVSMPFYSFAWPSIQLGLLKSVLRQGGHEVADFYLNLSFARRIGLAEYHHLGNLSPTLVGDWLFAKEAFGHDDGGRYLARNPAVLERLAADLDRAPAALARRLEDLRDQVVPGWIDHALVSTGLAGYDLVGFSCTFMQTVASVAMASRVKRESARSTVVFGGSAVEGPMGAELARGVEAIDHVVQGEGEHAILEIVEALEHDRRLPRLVPSTRVTDLDGLPVPDYDSYYELVDNDEELGAIDSFSGTGLPLETSRGCWWGEKHHCRFCGLNGATMKFRPKTAERTLAEMQALTLRYNRYFYQVVDRILGREHLKKLLPLLARSAVSYSMFFEVKSNLTFDDMKTLHEGGVTDIQPGIESLHTGVLRRMHKGVSAVQNLNALKWARYFGMGVGWNFLHGVPGERDEDYRELCALIPKVVHLQPPVAAVRVRLDRFSPYFDEWLRAEAEGVPREERAFLRVRPAAGQDLVYPPRFDPWRISFFYDGEARTDVRPETTERFVGEVERWKQLWSRKNASGERTLPSLGFLRSSGGGHVVDGRGAETETTLLVDEYFRVATVLDRGPLPLASVIRITGIPELVVRRVLDELIEAGFVLGLDGRYLWLPVPDP